MSGLGSGGTSGGGMFSGAASGGDKKDNKPSGFSFSTPAGGAPAGGSLFSGMPAKPGTGTNLFGNAPTSTPPPTSSVAGFSFGGGTPTSTTPAVGGGGGLFANNKPAATLFGPSSTPAGNPTSTQAPKPTKFGVAGGANRTTGGGLFGSNTGAGAGATTSQPATGGMYGSTAGMNKPAAHGGGSMFRGMSAAPTSSAPTGGLFGTTATTNTQTPSSGSLFGGAGPSSTPATGGLFGGGTNTNTSPASTTPKTTTPSLFGPKPGSTTAPPMFTGAATAATTSTPATKIPLFGPNDSTTPATQAPATGGSLFGGAASNNATKPGGLGGATATTPTTSQAPPAAPSGGLFSGSATPASTSVPAASNAAKHSLFDSPKPTENKPSRGGLFSGATPTTGATPSAGATSSATTAVPTLTTAPATGGLFGKAAPATTATTSAPTGGSLPDKKPESTGETTAGTASGAAADATGGLKATRPPPTSRLKNKSMDEIINRWTADLENYKVQFVAQAGEIKAFDEVLITNGEKIFNLHTNTQEAEKAQARMDAILQQLENEQEELGVTLDYYESQITNFFEAQFGSAEGMQPADQEREKTYSLAEGLNETLSAMESDLGEMIKVINKAGTTLGKTSDSEDPLSQIVKILNEHLSSLQWIDTHTTEVIEKIQDAQKVQGGTSGGDRKNVSTLDTDSEFFPGQSYRSAMK